MTDAFTVLFPDGWELREMVLSPPPSPGERVELGAASWIVEDVMFPAAEGSEPARIRLRALRRSDSPPGFLES